MRFNKYYLLLSLFLSLLFLVILLWSYLNKIDNKLIESRIRIVEKQATTKIEENIKIRVDAIKLLTKTLQLQKSLDSTKFMNNASIYYKNYNGFQAINWINKSGVIQWVYPYKGNEKAYGEDLHYHPDKNCRTTFLNAERMKEFSITPVIKLLQGGYGVVIYSPVLKKGEIVGYVNGVFNLYTFFNNILKDFNELYSIKISEGGRIYFNNSNEKNVKGYIISEFKLGSDTFDIFMRPRQVRVYHKIRSLLIILLGTLFSFSITLFVWILFKNIDEQKIANEKIYEMYKELHQKQHEFNTVIENNTDGILRVDRTGEIFQANEGFFRITGYDKNDKYPQNILEYTDNGNREILKIKIEKLITHNGTERLFEVEIRRKGGDIAIVEFNIIPIMENSNCNYLWIFARDLTEFYKLKDKTEQKTKMEAMGKVTGKVAHDFNNILTGIIGYSDMIINNPNGADKTIIEYAKNINRAGLSAKNLIKDLLLFSKNQKLNKEVFDLNKLIIEYTNILKGTIKKNISLKLDLDNEECIIDADKTKIESVLLNLITNAIDSIETEGIIKIKTRHKIENDSSYIILTIEDNGKGIPENIINRIYEPFFTTKREGKGTGLGLSIVYGIVMQHNGSISVRSKPNKGTTFEIAIPEFKSFSENNPSISDRKKKEMRKILLVDDDENSLDVITNMLKTLGYDVETADSAYNGLNLYKNNSDRYDLVIADYILPGMNGFEMLKDIQEINPALKAIIVSGYINDTSFLDNNEFVILIKPFTIDELSKVIKNLLK